MTKYCGVLSKWEFSAKWELPLLPPSFLELWRNERARKAALILMKNSQFDRTLRYKFDHANWKKVGHTLTLSLLISAMSFCMGFDLSFSALERLNPLASSCSRSSSSNFRRTLLYWRWRCFILAFLGESGSKKYRVKNKLSTSATRWYFTETTNKKWMIIWICVLQRTIANNYKLECPKMGMQ